MKRLGIVGGMGPESTLDYYRLLIDTWRARRADGTHPALLIDSVDVSRITALVTANDLAGLASYLVASLERLAAGGSDMALLSANTPHIVFDEVKARSPLPLISIVEAAGEAARARGLTRVGIFGSRFTMQGRFYPEVFTRHGIEIVAPDPEDIAWIHDKYMSELIPGIFLDATRDRLVAIAERMRSQARVEAVVLAGTELPLILRSAAGGFPFLDTARIHVERAIKEMLS